MTLQLPDGQHVLCANAFDALAGITPEPPAVSVVIPYFQAQADLDLVLAALTAQTHPSTRLEVLVVDDGSAVPPALGEAGGLEVRLLTQERDGFRAAAARNLGARAAEGSVLCFLDGDTVPHPGYVAAAARLPALCPDALVVGKRLHVDLEGWTPQRLAVWRTGGSADPAPLSAPVWLGEGYRESRDLLDADDRSFRYILSAVLTVGADLFGELDGFDERFRSYGGEDWELAARAYQAGAVLAHEPNALAWHNGPDWAGRGADPAEKNAETLMLADLITAPLTRGRSVSHRFPACAVTVDIGGWSAAAVYLTVDALLLAGDVGIWLTGGTALFADEPRVRQGRPSEEVLRRAQHQVTVLAPCVADLSALGDIRGSCTVVDGSGQILTVEATRALSRAGRWQPSFPHLDLVAELFGRATQRLARRIPDEPDLAGWFGGWAYQEAGQ